MHVPAEYTAVRQRAGVIDRRDRAILQVSGSHRLDWLQGMVSNDVCLIEPNGPAVQGCLLNSTGHLISDLIMFAVNDTVWFDMPDLTGDRVFETLDQFLITEDVQLELVTDRYSSISVQGPDSCTVKARLQRTNEWRVVPADHTGEGGFDIYLSADEHNRALAIFSALNIPILGSEVENTLRIEAGFPKFGVDMDERTIPLEAGLGATHISHTKGCYVGQEIIHRIYSRGHTNRELTGFRLEGESLPDPGETLNPVGEERDIGWITSSTLSPTIGSAIALGYLRHEYRDPGTRLVTERGTRAIVCALPFYRRN